MKPRAFTPLVPRSSAGLCCDDAGLALGPLALVTAQRDETGQRRYRAQPAAALRRFLSLLDRTLGTEALERCAVDIERVAPALNAGDEWRARLVATRLGLPALTPAAMAMLAADATQRTKAINPGSAWDSARHPRWPSGQSDGGRFRPNDGEGAPQALPVAARTGKPQAKAPAKPPSTAWKNYPNPEMREKLADLESSAARSDNGYGEPDDPKAKALGRYQFRQQALVEAGWKNKDGSWTEKAKEAGVTSKEEFLANPDAQEQALTDLLQKYTTRLRNNGAYAKIGSTVQDSAGDPIQVTEAGLLAAAHKEGPSRVATYLDPNNRGSLPAQKIANIENRLRAAADTPYDAAATAREANTKRRGPNAKE